MDHCGDSLPKSGAKEERLWRRQSDTMDGGGLGVDCDSLLVQWWCGRKEG